MQVFETKAVLHKIGYFQYVLGLQAPPEWARRINFRVNGVSYVVNSLPFGWAHSLIIAIEYLTRFLILAHLGQVILIQYLDDVLLVSTDATLLRWDTQRLVKDLVEGVWCLVSECLEPIPPDAPVTAAPARLGWTSPHRGGSQR